MPTAQPDPPPPMMEPGVKRHPHQKGLEQAEQLIRNVEDRLIPSLIGQDYMRETIGGGMRTGAAGTFLRYGMANCR